jgi:predicted transposase YdaD
MPAPENTPHDEFFKEIFGDIEHARDLLQGILPLDLREILDLDRLQRENASFLTAQLAEDFADLVFSCPVEGGSALVVLRYIFKRSGTTVREALALNLHPLTREQTMTMEEEILQRGERRGIEKSKLEAARKMREHGIDWTIVTDVAGVEPEDLKG